jgi:predicted GNAT superfamily acetyltransferase
VDTEAYQAAERAGVRVRELHGLAEIAEAAALFARVWGEPGACEPVPANVLSAFELSGSYLAGAFDGREVLVGASAGWASPPPRTELHSHITGVEPDRHGRGIGRALKLHQRSWAREHSLSAIVWTFDPLVRRNAAFNLRTLGASVERYLENAYGVLDDALNAGGESDRLVVCWDVTSTPVLEDRTEAHPGGSLSGGPSAEPGGRSSQDELVVETPEDIEALRRDDPAEASQWRHALRQKLAPALAAGGRVRTFTADGRYIVTLPPPTGREP